MLLSLKLIKAISITRGCRTDHRGMATTEFNDNGNFAKRAPYYRVYNFLSSL